MPRRKKRNYITALEAREIPVGTILYTAEWEYYERTNRHGYKVTGGKKGIVVYRHKLVKHNPESCVLASNKSVHDRKLWYHQLCWHSRTKKQAIDRLLEGPMERLDTHQNGFAKAKLEVEETVKLIRKAYEKHGIKD